MCCAGNTAGQPINSSSARAALALLPHSRGTACFCIDLYTGKESRYERMDVMGTMEPENLPGWARHGLTAIQQEQAQKKTNKERER